MPPPSRFAPGFRLSVSDAVFILAGIAVSFFARKEVAIPTATAVGHFFLFCNVFRIARRPELVWATVYVLLVTCTVAFGLPSWACSTAIAFAVGILLIARETRKPDYHGVGWKVLNPNLPAWWAERHGSQSLASKSAIPTP
jgi:hypothetical protein